MIHSKKGWRFFLLSFIAMNVLQLSAQSSSKIKYTPLPYQVAEVYQPQLSLNGVWEFSEQPTAEFWKKKKLEKHLIDVPGEWAMQGYKVDSAGTAGYLKTFEVPNDWKNKAVKVRFDGVHSECTVYLNGTKIGTHEGGMTPFELDLTRTLKKGKNRLALAVQSETTSDMLGSLTQYAAHQLGGITRNVTLFAVPKVHLSDLKIETDLDENYKDATLKVFVEVKNTTNKLQKDVVVKLALKQTSSIFAQEIGNIAPHSSWKGYITGKVNNPQKWDCEHPNLYTLTINLSKAGKTQAMVSKRIGFREISVKGNEMFVNGKAIKIHGVCRHESHPLRSRSISKELAREDLLLYRAANCNFIRTSHYPPSKEMIALCDELGFFVEMEAPVCWIGHGANKNWKTLKYDDPKYYKYVQQANLETVKAYQNHPSIIIWSIANESYWNQEFAKVLKEVERADSTRPTSFHDQAYGGFNNQGSTAQISNIHYPGPNGYQEAMKSKRPMTYGEYCHLNVYNRRELVTDPGIRSDWALALQPMWESMYRTKGALGGSIWSGIDDIFQLPNGNAVGYGAWGPIDGWRRPKPEYWDLKKIYSPIKVKTKELTPSSAFNLEVENRYIFSNLNEVKIKWTYKKEQGVVVANVAPGKTGFFKIPIQKAEENTQLYLSFTDARGVKVDEYILPVGKQKYLTFATKTAQKTKYKSRGEIWEISGEDFSCHINKKTGRITKVKMKGHEYLTNGPQLMVLPLIGGGCYPNHNAKTRSYNDLCSGWKSSSVKVSKQGDNVLVVVKGKYKKYKGEYRYVINASGKLSFSYNFKVRKNVNPRQVGLVFEAPASFDVLKWKRKGLWSIYPETHISRTEGTAPLFYAALPKMVNPRIKPFWSWNMDFNTLGSNDFRATRRNIWFASLQNKNGEQVRVESNGQQHWRSWKTENGIAFLVADFVTAGNEMFLGSHFASFRKPLKKGDRIKGTITLIMDKE